MPANLTQGLLSEGNITAANLKGPLAGQQLADLIDVFDNGTAYVNVHTKDFPLGEIRGQFSSEGAEPPSGLTGALIAGLLGNRTSVPDNLTMSTP